MENSSQQQQSSAWENVRWYEDEWCEIPEFKPLWEGWREDEHTELNELKQQIDALELDGTWELRKKMANPYELVFTYEDLDSIPQSLALIKPLSRSYFKMIEMLSLLDFFKLNKKQKVLRSTHVCEGPGGFIQAFLEMAQREKKPVDLALAMTLRPTHSQIPGWKRASHFLRKHPQVRICYGEDGTGDIYSLENQEAFKEDLGEQKSHLFTADGGFDFKTDYIHQEQKAFRLIVSSFAIAFQTLAKGGVCIVKIFDTFGRPTQELLAYVSCFFRNWTLYKPAMSRPCNSERYFIGSQFRGNTDQTDRFFRTLQLALQEHPVSDLEQMFESPKFQESLNHIQTFQKQFEKQQRKILTEAVGMDIRNMDQIWNHSFCASEAWCKHFKVPMRADSVLPSEALQKNQRLFDRQ